MTISNVRDYEFRHYLMETNHPGKFDPFNPDPAGALREAYAWISSPRLMTPDNVTYRVAHYNQLTEMLRRAIRNADALASEARRMTVALDEIVDDAREQTEIAERDARVRKFVPAMPARQGESV